MHFSACHAAHLRTVELASRYFRTDIERAEFAAVDWVDEYEASVTRKDFKRRVAMDMANATGNFEIAKCLMQALDRWASSA